VWEGNLRPKQGRGLGVWRKLTGKASRGGPPIVCCSLCPEGTVWHCPGSSQNTTWRGDLLGGGGRKENLRSVQSIILNNIVGGITQGLEMRDDGGRNRYDQRGACVRKGEKKQPTGGRSCALHSATSKENHPQRNPRAIGETAMDPRVPATWEQKER